MKASMPVTLKHFAALVLLFATAMASQAAPGDLDPTFAAYGKLEFGYGGRGGAPAAIAVQSDGKIVVVSGGFVRTRSFFTVRRYHADASPDLSFGGDGEVNTDIAPNGSIGASGNDLPSSVALQSDGKILVAGTSVFDGNSDFALARYNADGSLDSSFGSGGIVHHDLGTTSDTAGAVSVLPDGKIVVAGFHNVGAAATFTLALMRLHANGTPDLTFKGTGVISTPIGDGLGSEVKMVVQDDNKVVLATSLNGANLTGYRVLRYTTEGDLDPQFGAGTGMARIVAATEDTLQAVAIQRSSGTGADQDKIVVSGSSFNGTRWVFSAARFHIDGTPDSGFFIGSKVLTPIPGADQAFSRAMVIEGRGSASKIMLAGVAALPGGKRQFVSVRYFANGVLDTTWGGTGIVSTSFRGDDDAKAMALIGDKVLLAGQSLGTTNTLAGNLALARYHYGAGVPDNTFGTEGKKLLTVDSSYASASAVAVQSDGKIVMTGSVLHGNDDYLTLARLTADGALDETFDGDGKVPTGVKGIANALALHDGKIVIAGEVDAGFSDDFAVARYESSGAPDPQFGFGGVFSTPIGTGSDAALGVAVQTDGKIVAVGYGTSGTEHTAVVRFLPGGALDADFISGGKLFTSISSIEDVARAVVIQPDGKIVIAGYAYEGQRSVWYVARLESGGSFDSSFGTNGVKFIPFPNGDAQAYALALDAEGRIVVAGYASNGTDFDFAVARLSPADGSLDRTFNDSGVAITPIGSADDKARALVVQPDGRILLAGGTTPSFRNDNVISRPLVGAYAFVRYNVDGKPDPTYGSGGKAVLEFDPLGDDFARGVAVDSAGRAVVAGYADGLVGVARLAGGGALPGPGATPTATPAPTAPPASTPTPTPNRFVNISTRLRVETGENVLIGGFIVTGSTEKRIIIRALGPSLPVQGALANPVLELFDGNGQFVASNDNWQEAANKQEIIDSTIAPPNEFESAILRDVAPGAYTAVVRDAADGAGVGLVEIYDLGPAQDAKLANISTRGRVLTGESVMIGGLILSGSSPQSVILRAIGPSLPVNGRLEDPLLELFDGNGSLLGSNNNWKESQESEIEVTTIPPSNDLESAIVTSLPPGAYTAVVRGVNDTTGVALIEAYAL